MIHSGLTYLKKIRKPDLEPLNILRIDKSAIVSNVHYLQSLHPWDELIPVLKSNAYGHWLLEICQILQSTSCSLVAVDSFPEYQIVKHHSNKHILILSETDHHNYRYFDTSRVVFAVWNVSTLKVLGSLWKKVRIHIFLNTGLNREGVQSHQIWSFLEELKKYPQISVDWVMSHFAQADEIEWEESIQDQIKQFKHLYQKVEEYGHSPRLKHIGASAWTLRVRDSFFNAWRTWLSTYGYHPFSPDDVHSMHGQFLKPALSARSRIIAIQDIMPWEGVSYAKSWKASKKTKVWLLPFGYYEGLSRSLSNALHFSRKEKPVQQVWNICMNLCCVDLWDLPVQLYDEIDLFGTHMTMSVDHIAEKMQTISYEFLVKLNWALRREII
jgi:alanine racemase